MSHLGERPGRLVGKPMFDAVVAQRDTALARAAFLEDAIRAVLADEESQDGGWGPDVTTVAWLRDALNAAGPAREAMPPAPTPPEPMPDEAADLEARYRRLLGVATSMAAALQTAEGAVHGALAHQAVRDALAAWEEEKRGPGRHPA